MTAFDEDGFEKVERFKYKPIKNKRKSKKYQFNDSDDWKLEDILKVLKERKQVLEESRFYKELSVLLKEHLVPIQPVDIICYGIGSMQKSKIAQYQFILALMLRSLLNITGKMSIYDPVMTPLDKELSTYHSIDIIEENEDGKRSVDKPTLFYMPHCGRGLYSNTLSANWNKKQLPLVTIVGNRFDMYVGSQLEKDLIRECPYLIPVMDIVEVVSFPKEFDNNQIFNDMSIQTFPADVVSKLNDSFWTEIKTEKND
ncbi:hypothetical protein BDB01DRAFT_804046 [Pilobolus umbonatus]|nr:hypothetical protein BDB01DRAFT_804046 [Pilobolus umbonatus]